jgi:hypothetical protein
MLRFLEDQEARRSSPSVAGADDGDADDDGDDRRQDDGSARDSRVDVVAEVA